MSCSCLAPRFTASFMASCTYKPTWSAAMGAKGDSGSVMRSVALERPASCTGHKLQLLQSAALSELHKRAHLERCRGREGRLWLRAALGGAGGRLGACRRLQNLVPRPHQAHDEHGHIVGGVQRAPGRQRALHDRLAGRLRMGMLAHQLCHLRTTPMAGTVQGQGAAGRLQTADAVQWLPLA